MYLCTLKVRGDIALGSISGAKVRHRLSQAARANHWHGREDLRSRQGKGAQRPLGGRLSTGGGCHKPCQGPIHSEQLPSTSTGGTYSLSLCRGTFNVALYNYSLPGQDILVTSQILDYKEEKKGTSCQYQANLSMHQKKINVAQSSPVKSSACLVHVQLSKKGKVGGSFFFFLSFPPLEHHTYLDTVAVKEKTKSFASCRYDALTTNHALLPLLYGSYSDSIRGTKFVRRNYPFKAVRSGY